MTIGIFGDFEYKGYIWRSVFLTTDSAMSEDDRFKIRMQIADMYLNKKDKVKVRGEDYEGYITTNNKSHLLGSFYGQQFNATIETNHGKSKLSLIVMEPVDVSVN